MNMHSALAQFEKRLPENLRRVFRGLDSPFAVQAYLDSMPYIGEERDRSPLNVMLDGQCHCLDGGFLAALALWRIGFKPLILDIVPYPGEDDDHVLALYRMDGRWGAVAKSNYINLRFREPVYKSLRELVMTYFEHYCSVQQTKTLRGYTRPLDLSRYPDSTWGWDEPAANRLYRRFYQRKSIPLITPAMAARLSPIDDRTYRAETLYTNLNESFGIRPNH
jgi:hypothetical protein